MTQCNEQIENLRQQLIAANHGLEVGKAFFARVELLEQQLAEANHAHEFMSQQYKNLQRQLVTALAAIKAKDDALEKIQVKDDCGCWFPCNCYSWATMSEIAKEALAIQPDDSALRAWLGEPVRYLYQIHNCYGVPVWIDNYPRYGETVLETLPLYAPKVMK